MDLVRFKRCWLATLLALSILIISLGGLTRLTESGLSIVHWRPITGLLPPLKESAWARAMSDYKKSPEGRILNPNINLNQFKYIYFMEYAHRMLARLIGLWMLLPMLWLFTKRAINNREAFLFPALFALVLLQGFVGWLMVKSGLVDKPEVSHLRLVGHFALGYVFAGFVGVLLLKTFVLEANVQSHFRRARLFVVGLLLATQALLGSMTAGLKAGLLSDTFPKMNGQWVPEGLWVMNGFWQNVLNNPLFVVFAHRMLGTMFFFVVLVHYGLFWVVDEPKKLAVDVVWAEHVFLALTLSQVAFGVLTTISGVRIDLALLHQFWGVLLMFNWLFLMARARAVVA